MVGREGEGTVGGSAAGRLTVSRALASARPPLSKKLKAETRSPPRSGLAARTRPDLSFTPGELSTSGSSKQVVDDGWLATRLTSSRT